jgi:hypothetical protein
MEFVIYREFVEIAATHKRACLYVKRLFKLNEKTERNSILPSREMRQHFCLATEKSLSLRQRRTDSQNPITRLAMRKSVEERDWMDPTHSENNATDGEMKRMTRETDSERERATCIGQQRHLGLAYV